MVTNTRSSIILAMTNSSRPIEFVALPREIHCIIAKHVFYRRSNITAYALTCKRIHRFLQPLLYSTKVLQLSTFEPSKTIDNNTLCKTLLEEPNNAKNVRVMQVKSSSTWLRDNDARGFNTNVSSILPMCTNLVTLYILTDSLPLLFECLRNIPSNVRFLDVILTSRFRNLKRAHLDSLDTTISHNNQLTEFKFKSINSPVVYKNIHPELGHWNWNSDLAYEEAGGHRLNIGEWRNKWLHLRTKPRATSVCFKIAEVLHNFINRSVKWLKVLKIMDIDLAMVFSYGFIPMKTYSLPRFEELRLLEFDSRSMYRIHTWYSSFVEVNKAHRMVLIMYDDMGKSVYYKECGNASISQLDTQGNIVNWTRLDIGSYPHAQILSQLKRTEVDELES